MMKDATPSEWRLDYDDFSQRVMARLDQGAVEYQDKSFAESPDLLMMELQQELLDLAGWGFILWTRLQAMREKLSGMTHDA